MNIINSQNENTGDKFFKTALLNDHRELVCFVDPGSAVTTLKANVAATLQLRYRPVNEELVGFGNATLLCTQKAALRIKLDSVELEVDAFIVPNDCQSMPLLVGRNFTEDPRVAYVRVDQSLVFAYRYEDPFKNMILNVPQNKASIIVSADADLKPNEVSFLGVKVQHKEHLLPIGVREQTSLHVGEVIGEVRGLLVEPKTCDIQMMVTEGLNHTPKTGKLPITASMLNCGDTIRDEQKKQLLDLINEFRDCFVLVELGCTHLMEAEIEYDNTPVRYKPYRTNMEHRQIIKDIVEDWRSSGIVRETNSAYASPVLLVPKASGEKRLVVDFRKLNAQTVKQNFPIPHMDDCFEMLAGCGLFTTLDLLSGYLQVPLSEESKHKTAFITPDCTAEFQRLCFGLVNAPYVFSKLMNLVLGPLRNSVAVSYLDDILVPAREWNDILQRLRLIFERLLDAKLTLNLKKCEFGKIQIKFLGYKFTKDGLLPDAKKLDAIRHFPILTDKHEVKQFLGLTGFFRRFVPKYAQIARPLTELTKGSKPFTWQRAHDEAFSLLKGKLLQAPILQLYSPTRYTEVHCDASSLGVAGMLLQKGDDDRMHLVYCVSKKNSEAERLYHSSKLEFLAIVWCVERLRSLLLGIHFTVISDCQALVYLNAKRTQNPQIARWYTTLSEYDFDIKHRAGEKMAHVDSLSRAPVEEATPEGMIEEVYEKRIPMYAILCEENRVTMIQRGDERLRRLMDILKKEERSLEETDSVKDYGLDEGRLYRKVTVNGEEKWLYVIPDNMRKATVVKFHDQRGHWSLDRTVAAILTRYWFRGLRRYVKHHIGGCFECFLTKTPGGRKPGLLNIPKVPEKPMQKIHVDHVGPFIRSEQGNMHILVIVDALTRFVKLYPSETTSATDTVNHVEKFVTAFGAPDVLVSDRGTAFTSTIFKEFCGKYFITHRLIASHYS